VVLPANAVGVLEAVPLQQLNAAIAAIPPSGPSQAYVDAADALRVLKAGDTMTGALTLPGNAVANLQAVPLQQLNAAIAAIPPSGPTQAYVDAADNLRVLKAGDTMTNQLQITAPANASSVGQNLLLNGSISPTIRFHDGTNPAFGMLYYSGSMWLCSFASPAGTGENDICFFSTSLIEFRKNLSMANNRIRQVGAPLSGDEATNRDYVDTAVNLRVLKAGDTMTGPLVLPGNASASLQAVPLQQLNSAIAGVPTYTLPTASTTVLGGVKVDGTTVTISGGGVISSAGGGASITVGVTPPTLAVGALWWDSNGGQLYVGYNDGTSLQWVPASNPAVGSTFADPVFTGNPTAPNPPVNDADQTVATTKFVSDAVATSLHDMGRNLIHNPMFNVLQRGGGPWTTNAAYTADRWMISGDGTFSVIPFTLTDTDRAQIGDEGAYTALQMTFTGAAAAGSNLNIQQPMELTRRFGGKTLTVSFWVRLVSGAATKIGMTFFQTFGSGGSTGGFVPATGTSAAITSTWQRVSASFAIPSMSGKTLGANDALLLCIAYSSGATYNANFGNIGVQSGVVQIWGVQCEYGPTATPLERMDYADDLRRSQRFYQTGLVQSAFVSAGISTYTTIIPFPVPMRALPAMTSNYTTQTNATGSVNPQGGYGYQSNAAVTVGAGSGVNVYGSWTASADL
jgi:hypothetical protein